MSQGISTIEVSFLLVATVIASWFLFPLAWATALLTLRRTRAGIRAHRLRVRGREWFYLDGGSGPVVLALHGFGSDADNWVPVSKTLTRHFRVIAPDLPGFGRSEAGSALDFDIASHVARLREFVLALDVSPNIMVGSSMGGWVATAYANCFPDEISALWLLAPLGVSAGRTTPMLEAIELGNNSPFRKATLSEFKQQIFKPMFGKQPWLPFPMLVYYARRAERLENTASAMFKELRGKSESLESIAQEIELPVLLQWGDQDNAVDVSGAKVLQNSFGRVTIKIHENTGHLPMLERPHESGSLLLKFCKQNQLFGF